MLDRYPFWRAGGARCIHYATKIFRLRWGRLDRVVLAELSEFFNAHDGKVFVCSFELVNEVLYVYFFTFCFGVVDDMFHILGIFQGIDQARQQVRVRVDGFGLGLDEGMLHSLLAKGVVCGGYRDRLGDSSMRRGKPIRTVGAFISSCTMDDLHLLQECLPCGSEKMQPVSFDETELS